MRALEPWHIIVLVVVIGILFGGKRLPDAARGLGRSMRIFKSEMTEMKHDDPKQPAKTEPIEGRIMDANGSVPRPGATTPSDRRDV